MTARETRRRFIQAKREEMIKVIRKRDAQNYDAEILRRITESLSVTKRRAANLDAWTKNARA